MFFCLIAGWWLSMDPHDSFLHKLQPLSEILQKYERKNRFGKWNEKTLGFLLVGLFNLI